MKNKRRYSYQIRKAVLPNECHMIENGVDCKKTSKHRGLCDKHYTRFFRNKRLKQYGKPSQRNVKEFVFKIKPYDTKGGITCRIFQNLKPCHKFISCRGVCRAHYSSLTKLGMLDKYALPSPRKQVLKYEVKKIIKNDECLIVQSGDPCLNASISRGICNRHRLQLIKAGLIDIYALPSQREKR